MTDPNHIISIISSVRTHAADYLETELAAAGAEGLIASHGSILGILFRNGGKLRMKEIAEKINRDKSTVTHHIHTLIRLGYVKKEKSGADGRETFVVLTAKGLKFEEPVKSISRKLLSRAYRNFTEEEKQSLIALLEKMRANFED